MKQIRKELLIAMFLVACIVAGIALGFALNQMDKRIDAESQLAETNTKYTRLGIRFLVIEGKLETCMQVNKFSGRND